MPTAPDAPAPSRWDTASPWARSLPRRSADRPPSDRHWDVAVVGAGLTGLLTATVLRQAGLEVVVLERHGIGGVTSRGSTGKLTALQGARSSKVRELRNAEAAERYAAAATFGVAGLRSLIETMGIDCHLTAADDLTFATEPQAVERCAAELEAASAAGLPVRWVDTSDLPFPILGAVQLDGQAHLDPGALCAGLADHLGPEHVVTGWPVLDVDQRAEGVELQGPDGARLRADHVVIATLGPIHDPALLATRCSAMRSYGVAAPHDAPPASTSISLDESSRSIRPASGPAGTGVIVVGEGHVMGEYEGRPASERWAALEQYARSTLGAGVATHRWVAHDLVPSDGVPFIGRLHPGAHRAWVATGFQKWGISTAFVAADLIAGAIQGEDRPWSEVFDPGRIAASATTELARGAVRSVKHLIVEPVAAALSGDDAGPRCTHLGCSLAFDDEERTWDCPCHGSRFDEAGQVISGPATRPLDLTS